ncbi:MurR/RpiR family transcriptional regulator [Labrys wisconsinensis]|uniref:DNA-binding MurR/RpiR family transcriptional regulator n=1 Tax=Labrys wisconsinensis TaxID=425677 RepID=A0ABU0JF82_9HYPH|nr:MurR/RpiR family transcriptional regulator [Labrys wisconsinensis]MDQ0472260.1 DNA-binding MurR/RpiR family transcriptional regulator [Labrys wisconsinensis]
MIESQHDAPQAGFAGRIAAAAHRLSPAERRVAHCLAERRDAVLLGSAAEIAALARTSDATVVRAVRALGFDGLAGLRQAMLAEITGAPTPAGRLAHTLEEAGGDSAQALRQVVAHHEASLATLRDPGFEAGFTGAIDILFAARRRHIFGIGPSGAMADYAALQFSRIGCPSSALSVSGVALADRLLAVEAGDVVLAIAYAPLYREVEAVLERASGLGVPVVLVSDSLGPILAGRVAQVLPVPRGRADHLALHGATLVLIEAMIVGLAARDRDRALASLTVLGACRGAVDKAWAKRGARSRPPVPLSRKPR